MNRTLGNLVQIGVVTSFLVVSALSAAAQSSGAAVAVDVSGRFARGGEFRGTATINAFELRDDHIVAVGVVRGTLSRGGRAIGSGLAAPVAWTTVQIRASGVAAVAGPARRHFGVQQARWMLAQAEPCPVVDIALGPVDVNLLGVVVALDPIALDLHGEMGTPLGELVCQVSDLLVNVAGLVGVLNGILGLLTGLLGGLGGIVPMP
jgi:hypothetical protein